MIENGTAPTFTQISPVFGTGGGDRNVEAPQILGLKRSFLGHPQDSVRVGTERYIVPSEDPEVLRDLPRFMTALYSHVHVKKGSTIARLASPKVPRL